MKEFKNLINQTFNRWTVIGKAERNKFGKKCWLCQCECKDKTIRIVPEYELIKGKSKSCGCFMIEKSIETITKYNLSKMPENDIGATSKLQIYPHYKRLFSIYDGMRKRCYNENNDNYQYYGGRGIIICEEWLYDFMLFYNWAISHGYDNKLTIDRIEVNGNYEPDNCRWVTWEEQANNKSNTVYYRHEGKIKSSLDWCKETWLTFETLKNIFDIHIIH